MAVCRFLEEENDLEVIGKVADGAETVRLAKELYPDVAMPQLGGIEAARQFQPLTVRFSVVNNRIFNSPY